MKETTEAPDTTPPVPSRRFGPLLGGRRRRIVLAVALAGTAAGLGVWTQRKPIATRYIDHALATAGVRARYAIADLGLGRQRLTGVVLGDPAHPDLVADWVETHVAVGLSGPYLASVHVGHVRLLGRLVNGHVSLATVDRLLPAPSGKPFALPHLDVTIDDARMRLETPHGLVGLKFSGAGRLDDGFAGTAAALSERLTAGGCTADRVAAAVRLQVERQRPVLAGPVRVARLACGGASVSGVSADLDLTLGVTLDRWQGQATVVTGAVLHPALAAEGLSGTIDFAGSAAGTSGHADIAGAMVRAAAGGARRVVVSGAYRIGGEAAFDGRIRAGGASLSAARRAQIAGYGRAAEGTPVGPLADRAAGALAAAANGFAADGDIAARLVGGQGGATLSRLSIASASGTRLAIGSGQGISVGWPGAAVRIDTDLSLRGGGLPVATIALRQAAPGAPITGVARVEPYAAVGARLALTPVVFTANPDGVTRISTQATLSGPVGRGHVDAASLPIAAVWDGRGRLVVNAACAPLSVDRLAASGLVLDRSRITLCPVDGALVRIDGDRMQGGAQIACVRLGGRLGTTPVALVATGATLRLADRRFTISGVQTRIGAPDRLTRLDFATLDGRIAGGTVGGTFAGGSGQIGSVPLLLSAAAGDWTLAGGDLSLHGAMTIADAASDPRFNPLAAHDVALTLRGGVIEARGALHEPTKDVKVADVTIRHTLASGTGTADLRVPGISFTENFQPELLTKLTFGVIADVRGTVDGTGDIAWSPAGVTSTGGFRTGGIDLAAAFGPVSGVAGEIRFTDLLALQSAPGQVATVKTINPGIPVSDGVIRYQTLPGARISVEGARWPFAGGTLTLDPTLLDFSAARERRMTFHVAGMAADQFLQQFDFKNLDATGVFDGVLPMIFDVDGGRIEQGTLAVRDGGGTIAYVGDITQKDVGFWGNLAFQALRSLRYRSLGLGLNGPLAGEMVTEVRFAGVTQGKGAKSNFLVRRLQKLPFVFNIRITAPFRGLLDSAASFYDPKRLIQRNLPALLEEQDRAAAAAAAATATTATPPIRLPIQPTDSRTAP